MDDSKAATDLSEFTPIYRLAVKATFWNLQMESGQSKSVEHQRPSAEENQASLDHSHFACCILQAGGSAHWSLPYPDFMKKQCKKDITSISPEKTLVNSFLVKLLFWSSQMMCWITQLFIPPPPLKYMHVQRLVSIQKPYGVNRGSTLLHLQWEQRQMQDIFLPTEGWVGQHSTSFICNVHWSP